MAVAFPRGHMRVLDSRRLTGPSLMLDAPGAILDVALDGVEPDRAVEAWRSALALLLEAVGWVDATVVARVHAAGLSLAFSAPADTLYAATEVNEAAWNSAAIALGASPGGETPDSDPAILATLRTVIAAERALWFDVLARETQARGVTLLADDRRISVGLGSGSRAWPVEETPAAINKIRWSEIADIPTALVTGTNGKTTTVRLLGAMAQSAGLIAGVTSTDHVTVGDEVVASGDYSGPNGARTVLRDRRVQIALLEIARGGILRRGLPLPRAGAALVTNVANDHLGEFGIFDLEALADVKLVVAKAIGPGGHMVLNADDPLLLERGLKLNVPVLWFTLDPGHAVLARHLERGGQACLLDGDRLVIVRGSTRREIIGVADVPITLGGAARHNVANALAAMGVAAALGLPYEDIRTGLARFAGDTHSNPGRANLWRLGGVTAIVDFAHNPHGLAALAHMLVALPAKRRGVVLGQAGDRDDDAIRELAGAAWTMGPAHVFIKEMDHYLRGREPGEIPALIEAELRRLGAEAQEFSHWPSELAAVQAALEWAREGDLLLLTTHEQRDVVIALLDQMRESEWAPGQPIPRPDIPPAP